MSLRRLLQRLAEIFVRNLQKIGIGHHSVLDAGPLSWDYQVISDVYFARMEADRLRAEAHAKSVRKDLMEIHVGFCQAHTGTFGVEPKIVQGLI